MTNTRHADSQNHVPGSLLTYLQRLRRGCGTRAISQKWRKAQGCFLQDSVVPRTRCSGSSSGGSHCRASVAPFRGGASSEAPCPVPSFFRISGFLVLPPRPPPTHTCPLSSHLGLPLTRVSPVQVLESRPRRSSQCATEAPFPFESP